MAESKRAAVTRYLSDATKPLRPVLTSLNGDNSWLMSFLRPRPEQAATGKAYYHIAFEPWLKGPANVVHSWFIQISRTSDAGISDVKHIEAVAKEIEQAAAIHMNSQNHPFNKDDSSQIIDAILLEFHIQDHLHEPTLRTFSPDIPVIATPRVAKIVQAWDHFTTIRVIQDLDPSATCWREPSIHPGEPLPAWLTPIRMPGHADLNFAFALIWSHTSDDQEIHEVILNSPHGVKVETGPLDAFIQSEPKTKKLAMLHGLKESHTGGVQTTFGAKAGLALYRSVGGVKYWIPSHSSRLDYRGVFMRVIWTIDTPRTVDWAVEQERKGGSVGDLERPNCVQIPNGGSMVLES
ncbi:hypothetical protein F66182_825 [Fusarium sp. NRRL 66182]|nr:hypothetical protein F66182_825 [Fusarium sp. NRRL 66182]